MSLLVLKGKKENQCATSRNLCTIFCLLLSLLHNFLHAFVLPLHFKGSVRGDAVRDGSTSPLIRGCCVLVHQCWCIRAGVSVQTAVRTHLLSECRSSRWMCIPVCSHVGHLQQNSCSSVGGKCALLGGGESCCEVLSYADTMLHVGGGALGEDPIR